MNDRENGSGEGKLRRLKDRKKGEKNEGKNKKKPRKIVPKKITFRE